MEQLIYLNALNVLPVTLQHHIWRLLTCFRHNAKLLWHASFDELAKTSASSKLIQNFTAARIQVNPMQEWEKIAPYTPTFLIHPHIYQDVSVPEAFPYPQLLAHIPQPPLLLYCVGNPHACESAQLSLGIVGSRKVSAYGRRVTEDLAYALAENNFLIISGLAEGVDTITHAMCIKAGKPTVGILATGIDSTYPRSNTKLVQSIIDQNGALLSEFPIGTPPYKSNFRQRNRIISGLSHGIVITEAAQRSGSLITASHAIEQNRELFVVPGNIYSKNSQGTNHLIKQGAKLVTCVQDIAEEFGITIQEKMSQSSPPAHFASPLAQSIYRALSADPLYVGTLIKMVGCTTQEINTALSLLELQGRVKNNGAGYYSKL